MGGDSRGFMGMGSLLGQGNPLAGQSQSDLMNQMGAAQANMYAQQQAMMQAQMYHIPHEFTAAAMRERETAAQRQIEEALIKKQLYVDPMSQMIRKLPKPDPRKCPPPMDANAPRRVWSDKKARWEVSDSDMLPPPPIKNIDRLRAEVAAWTRRAA